MHRDYAVPAPVQIRVYDDKLSLWNPALLPQGWTVQKLHGDHPSRPFNPDIANTFFRAGEIEAWGRGVQQIFQACHEADTPEPQLRFETGEMWLDFAFASDYLQTLNPTASRETISETPVKTPDRMLVLLRQQPALTLAEVAA